MKKLIIFLGVILALSYLLNGVVFAEEGQVVYWGGNGSDNLPCHEGGYWVLSPAQDVTGATLYFGGNSYSMWQTGGNWKGISVGVIDEKTPLNSVYVVYQGDLGSGHLQLSHCTDAEATPTNTPFTPPTFTPTSTTEITPTSTIGVSPTPSDPGSPTPSDPPTPTKVKVKKTPTPETLLPVTGGDKVRHQYNWFWGAVGLLGIGLVVLGFRKR